MFVRQGHKVSPPNEGIILLYKIDAKAGFSLKVKSVCQTSVSDGLFLSYSNKTISL